MRVECSVQWVMDNFHPGSQPQPWTWDDEERDILARTCCCRSHMCSAPSVGAEGHYQLQLEEDMFTSGAIPVGILLGDDGRVWDGHHRLIAARRLGMDTVFCEMANEKVNA